MRENLNDSAATLKNIFKEYYYLIVNNGSDSRFLTKDKYNEIMDRCVRTLSERGLLLVMAGNKLIISFEDVKDLNRELFKTWPYYSYKELDEMGLCKINGNGQKTYPSWMINKEAKLKEYFQDQYLDCLERIENYKLGASTPKDTVKQASTGVAINPQKEKQHIQPLQMPEGTRWEDIKLVFIDRQTVNIYLKGKHYCKKSYIEMGFKDKRTAKPIESWHTLENSSGTDGIINYPGGEKGIWEKKISTLRKKLQVCFGITDDPLPYIKKEGYKTRFTITDGEISENYRKHETPTDPHDMENIADDDRDD